MGLQSTGSIPPNVPRYLSNLLRFVAVAMAASHTAVAVISQSMNEDGINYLDMGDAYLDGDWAAAISSTWSPVYGVIVALFVRIANPAMDWEFPTVQVVNLGIFVVALLSFEYFWRRLSQYYYRGRDDAGARMPPITWHVLGYSLFIWMALDLIQIWAVTPDMCVAAVVFLAAGRMLVLPESPHATWPFVALGLLLGFGYMVKAALLPLGLVALALAAATARLPYWKRARNFLLSLAAALAVAGPLILALSISSGQLTTGDVGRFTYLKHVNEMPYPDFHEAAQGLHGSPENPPRRIFDEPPIYEFAAPVAGTYPMAYDPGYWTRGIEPVIDLPGQARALVTNGMFFFEFFFREQGAFLAVVLLLGVVSFSRQRFVREFDPAAALVLWSLAAFGMYSLIHTLPRYIAPFVVLFWLGILAKIRLPDDASARKFIAVGAALLAAFIWIQLIALNLDGVRRVTGFTPLSEQAAAPGDAHEPSKANHPELAAELRRMGLKEGDGIGFIGYSYTEYWARLARLRIIAEIHSADVERFWALSPSERSQAIDAFAATGAVAVIAAPTDASNRGAAWEPIADSGYLLAWLR